MINLTVSGEMPMYLAIIKLAMRIGMFVILILIYKRANVEIIYGDKQVKNMPIIVAFIFVVLAIWDILNAGLLIKGIYQAAF